ncbi:MAG TPA: peptidyl-prolyl cis-trans isomerase [bacterium]|nr:peptidyl-prolyl cis-trans isomerase [bacterium]
MKKLLLLLFVLILPSCGTVNKHPVVVMETNLGDIELTLDAEKAPVTVKNFLSYVEESFYDSLIFHRIVPRFVIQAGGYNMWMKPKKSKDPIKNESGNGLINKRGSIAMARSNAPNSATSQFYINIRDNFRLDEMRYAVFGEVTLGMDVVDKIASVETNNLGGAFTNAPVEAVVILSMSLME